MQTKLPRLQGVEKIRRPRANERWTHYDSVSEPNEAEVEEVVEAGEGLMRADHHLRDRRHLAVPHHIEIPLVGIWTVMFLTVEADTTFIRGTDQSPEHVRGHRQSLVHLLGNAVVAYHDRGQDPGPHQLVRGRLRLGDAGEIRMAAGLMVTNVLGLLLILNGHAHIHLDAEINVHCPRAARAEVVVHRDEVTDDANPIRYLALALALDHDLSGGLTDTGTGTLGCEDILPTLEVTMTTDALMFSGTVQTVTIGA